MKFDPNKAPDPETWLELDEDERILLVEQFHKKARIKLPNTTLHATLHVIIENQLAEGDEHVQRTVDRLVTEGLDRHDAVHAVCSVLTNQIWEAQRTHQTEFSTAAYYKALDKQTAKKWLASV